MTAAERAALEELRVMMEQAGLFPLYVNRPDLWTLKEILEKCNFYLHPPATYFKHLVSATKETQNG